VIARMREAGNDHDGSRGGAVMKRRGAWIGGVAAGLLTAALVLGLSGGSADLGAQAQQAAPAMKPQAKVRAAFIYVSPVGDGGWTFAHDQARKATEKAMGEILSTAYSEAVPEGAQAEQVIERYVRQGFNLIFTTSFGYMDPTLAVAERHPDTVFMHCSGFKTAPNMGTYFGRMYQARYLSGLVAGKMTKSNVIGYVAAHPIPEVIRGIDAFTLGVRAANGAARVHVVWTNSWYDPPKEREAAESLLDINADVIAQHQDTPGPQQAAEKRGRYSVGYNSDMRAFAPRAHLTAPIWHWEKIYTEIVKQVNQGTWKSAQLWPGLDSGVVDLAPFNPAVPAEVQRLVEEKKAEIVAKRWDVFTGPIKDQEGKVVVEAGKRMTDPEMLSMNFFVEGVVGTLPKK
jgi:basic membrane protein A